MKKTLVSALTTALVVGAASTTFAAANPFADVPADHWAYDAVAQLASDGVVNGYPADGQFKGDATMTRYEMAQIVAKAMAKADSTYANKAMLDKLAAEFADELANLGVRVAALENKVDNVKWNGLIRYEYKQISGDDKDTTDANQTYLRLDTTMQINENWEGHARLEANLDGEDDNVKGNGNVSIDRAWAEGHYTNFTVKIGRMYQWDNATRGLLMDNVFTGVEVDFGKTVQVVLAGGRAASDASIADPDRKDASATYGLVELRYVGEKFDIGAGYRTFKNGNWLPDEDSMNIWNIGAGYKFNQDWQINAAYARANGAAKDDNETSYRFQLQYGAMDPAVAGTFDVILSYQKMNTKCMNKFASGDVKDGAFKGWGIQVDYAPIENIALELAYGDGEDYNDNTDKNIFYGKVEFLF